MTLPIHYLYLLYVRFTMHFRCEINNNNNNNSDVAFPCFNELTILFYLLDRGYMSNSQMIEQPRPSGLTSIIYTDVL
jgi:hypothetical protein